MGSVLLLQNKRYCLSWDVSKDLKLLQGELSNNYIHSECKVYQE